MTVAAKPSLRVDLEQKRDERGRELDALIDEREGARAEFEALEEPTDEQRKAEEAAELDFRSAVEDCDKEIVALDERVDQQRSKERRRQTAEGVEVGRLEAQKEPMVYRADNAHEVSYMKDLMLRDRKVQEETILDVHAGLERLARHGRQIEEEYPKREAKRKDEAEKRTEEAEREFRGSFPTRAQIRQDELVSPFERRVSPSRETGHGGEFIPPDWEISAFSEFLRAGRVIAQLPRQMPLPPGTDVVKIPRVKTGSEVAAQLADNAGLPSKDIETEFIEAPIKTVGGIQDVALQAIEQSPNQIFGTMVQEDLLADWNRRVDREVSFGSGTAYSTLNAGTIKGLYPASNWGGEAHESTSAISGQTILQGLGCNRSFIATKRFNTDNVHHVVHPKRGEFLLNTYDITSETGRRLFEPAGVPQFNVSGVVNDGFPAEGLIVTLPSNSNIYQSANISTEANKAATVLKAGETFDYGLTAKWDDVWFYESDVRMGVFSEVLSGTLTVRYRLYSYIGMLVRFEPSVQVCGGKPFEKEPTLGGYKYGA